MSYLNIGTHVINILDRDHAAGTVYCFAEMGSPGSWDRQAIAYEDDYERRGGRWYFSGAVITNSRIRWTVVRPMS